MIPENEIVEARTGLHMEILEPSTRKVWQTLQPVTRANYEALDPGPAFIKVGIASGAMDASYFRRSPGADEDGPMQTLELGGHTWSYCARPSGDPPTLPGGEKGPRQLSVDKHHTLVFWAGRSLPLIRLPDGTEYVHTIQGREALLALVHVGEDAADRHGYSWIPFTGPWKLSRFGKKSAVVGAGRCTVSFSRSSNSR